MLTFDKAFTSLDKADSPAILLGNGFSQAWNAGIFNYANLLAIADFGPRDKLLRSLFDRLGTYDFEAVMRVLLSSETVLELYSASDDLLRSIKEDQEVLKNALLVAVSATHPSLPSEVTQAQYQSVRKFLSGFGKIFTVNYDLLMYWARNASDMPPAHWRTDDGFRAGCLWMDSETHQDVFFLHGGLHIYEDALGVKKHIYSQVGNGIIEQVKTNLAINRFPLFVSEPTQEKKKQRIDKSPYLAFCYRALREISDPIFIYGHSLDENDRHIFRELRVSPSKRIFISIYGDENSEANVRVKANALAYFGRPGRDVEFFDANTANVWG